ncbi:hypothetical protein [Actinomadura fibrosa]|uniref:hypothetical protein n=1 Tax=Actinomadura fibrosa TaxID=111802 RepID=UPI001041306A|nr:hypothetical protein [Actinomadura fibrosa]
MTLSVIILLALMAGLLHARRATTTDGSEGARSGKNIRPLASPPVALAVVTATVYLNQVLFTVYVLRCHGGDPSFIARYLPAGWFALAHSHTLDALAGYFPFPGLLAPSVLRVQAFLELPFVVFGYLTVCRWFSATAYRAALRLVWPVSLSYTATFCLIEWSLRNPYTMHDILIRVIAAIAVPLWAAQMSGDAPGRVHNLPGLLVFALSAVALGVLVLVVYDTALLYNLGHLNARLPVIAGALAVLACARVAARCVTDARASRGIDSITRSFGHLLVLFFVPALPIRYGLNFGTAPLSALASLALAAVATGLGVRETLTRIPGRLTTWILQMAATVTAGLGGMTASILLPARYAEARLLWAAAAFFVCAVTTCSLIDRLAAAPAGSDDS